MDLNRFIRDGSKTGLKARMFHAAQLRKHRLMREKTIQENRVLQHKLSEMLPVPLGVSVRPGNMAGVPCEWVSHGQSRADRVILYIHGGSWLYGDLRTAQAAAGMLSELCDFPVLAVDYRLAPEYPYPAGLEDCFRVYNQLLRSGYAARDIGVFGDSAGGNLALCLQHKLRQEGVPRPAVLCCASPVTDLTKKSPMYIQKPDLLYAQYKGEEHTIFSLYLQGQDPSDPLASPVCGDLAGLPPTLIHVGEHEALCRDNIVFAAKAKAQGADVTCKVWPDMFHDFTIAGAALKESRLSMKEMAAHFTAYLK